MRLTTSCFEAVTNLENFIWRIEHLEKKDIPSITTEHDIELPQSIIDSFARFLVPEIRKYYESEQGQKEFEEWEATQQEQ